MFVLFVGVWYTVLLFLGRVVYVVYVYLTEYGIFRDGSQILTNQKLENSVLYFCTFD